jgi:hypothetical protein
MKLEYSIRMQNANNQYAKMLSKVKENYKCDQPFQFDSPTDYKQLSLSVQKTMKDVVSTQKTFETKKKLEQNAKLKPFVNIYEKTLNVLGINLYGEWSDLFDRQLTNVTSLNSYLASLIRNSDLHSKKLRFQLQKSIDNAKSKNDVKQKIIEVLPSKEKIYSEKFEELKKIPDSKSEHYDLLDQSLESEDELVTNLNELRIVKSAHKKDLEKFEFLKRHYAFHRGLTFTAKNLAVTTAQICSSLEHLIGIYETVRPMSACLEGIHSGITDLQGYTDLLNETYNNTFKVISNIENSEKFDLLSLNSNQLNGVVSGIIENLEEKLEQ